MNTRRWATVLAATTLCSVTLMGAGCSSAPDEQTQQTMNLIEEIGEVSADSGNSIQEASEAYNELSDSQKNKVDNHDTLVKAQHDFNQIEAENVSNAIAGLGDITIESEDAVSKTRAAYDSLNDDAKKLVENADALTAAEEKLEVLKKQFAVGSSVQTDKWNITLTSAKVSETLSSPQSSTYWKPSDGGVFLILEFDVTALTGDKLPVDSYAITDLVARYNEADYESWTISYLANQLWLYIRNTYLDANLPQHLYVYTTVPKEALSNGSLTVDMKLAGEEKTVVIR